MSQLSARLTHLPGEVLDQIFTQLFEHGNDYDDIRALMMTSTLLYERGVDSAVWEGHLVKWRENSFSYATRGLIPRYARSLSVRMRQFLDCLHVMRGPARYPHLTSLSVSGMSSGFWQYVPGLTQLTFLGMSENLMYSTPLTVLSSLRELQLDGQALDSHFATTLARLSSLSAVQFYRASVFEEFRGSFTSIQRLSLLFCEVYVPVRNFLGLFPSVNDLYEHECNFYSGSDLVPTGVLRRMHSTSRNLDILDVSRSTSLEEFTARHLPSIPSSLCALQVLQSLTLTHATFTEEPVVDESLKVISKLTQLTSLDVCVLPFLQLLRPLTRLVNLSVRLISRFHPTAQYLMGVTLRVEFPALRCLHVVTSGHVRQLYVSHLTGLTELLVERMEVSGMSHLTNLMVLSVSQSSSLRGSDFSSCLRLKQLSLREVSIQPSFLPSFSALESLRMVDVYAQPCTDFLTSLRGLCRLTELRMEGRRWVVTSRDYVTHIRELTNLRCLKWELQLARIDSRLACSILPLRHLTGLDMIQRDCRVSFEDREAEWAPFVQQLTAMRRLRLVNIMDAPPRLTERFPQWLWSRLG